MRKNSYEIVTDSGRKVIGGIKGQTEARKILGRLSASLVHDYNFILTGQKADRFLVDANNSPNLSQTVYSIAKEQ